MGRVAVFKLGLSLGVHQKRNLLSGLRRSKKGANGEISTKLI